jgi:hypothetical protein
MCNRGVLPQASLLSAANNAAILVGKSTHIAPVGVHITLTERSKEW